MYRYYLKVGQGVGGGQKSVQGSNMIQLVFKVTQLAKGRSTTLSTGHQGRNLLYGAGHREGPYRGAVSQELGVSPKDGSKVWAQV